MPFFYDKKINKLKILKSKLTFSMFYLKILLNAIAKKLI